MADSPAAIKTAVMAHLGGKSCVEINNLEPLIFFFPFKFVFSNERLILPAKFLGGSAPGSFLGEEGGEVEEGGNKGGEGQFT